MKPTASQIVAAVGEIGMCRYFPAGDAERKAIMRLVGAMVGTKQQLDWLVATMVNQIGEWPGPKEFRGVFCSRFKPADGIEADCAATVGFTPGELEAGSISAHEDRKALTSGRDQKLIAGPVSAIPGIDEEFVAAMGSSRPVRTTSVARRAAPEDVKRTDDLLRQLMREGV